MSNISKFFGAATSSTAEESSEPITKKAKVSQTASIKTVRKWEKDLDIELGKTEKDGVVNKIWCVVCHEFGTDRSSTFVTGCMRIKKEAVSYHRKAVAHEQAVKTKIAKQRQERNEPSELEKGFRTANKDVYDRMAMLFRSAYFLVKKERPYTDFPDIIELQCLNGVNLGETYRNDKAAKEFVKTISEMFLDELKTLLKDSDFFSLFCDGSTDKSESEKEIIMVKVLKDFYPRIFFLKLEEPPNTKAHGIVQAINNAFSEIGMPDYKQKLIGFCSDGASVMMGARRGVISLLKEEGNVPWLLSVWCLAHKLELAIKDSFKDTYMDTVVENLTSIYYFYKGSAKRNKEASDIAEIMEEHFLKPAKANGTRWVEHKLLALTKMIKNWKVIVMHLMNYAEDNSNKGEDRAKAKGIIKKLTQYKFVWYMYFLKDVLSEVSRVSLLFQRNDINVASAMGILQTTKLTLQDMKDNAGPQLQEFDTDVTGDQYKDHTLANVVPIATLSEQKRAIVQAVLDCLDNRFSNMYEDTLYLSCLVFDHKNWPDTEDALRQYGVEEVRTVCRHFQTLLANADCDQVDAVREWLDLKLHVRRIPQVRAIHPLSVWQRVSEEDVAVQHYQNILKVIHLSSLYPLSNASCERGFSNMKRIKNDWRCRLSTESLNILMRIDIEGPKLADFDPRAAVHRWYIGGELARRPHIQPYGAHH